MQAEAEAAEYFPEAQLAQAVAPEAAEKRPATQAVQLPVRSAGRVEVQPKHCSVPEPALNAQSLNT